MDRLLRLKIGKVFLNPHSRLGEVSGCGLDIWVPCFVSRCIRPAVKLTFPLVQQVLRVCFQVDKRPGTILSFPSP